MITPSLESFVTSIRTQSATRQSQTDIKDMDLAGLTKIVDAAVEQYLVSGNAITAKGKSFRTNRELSFENFTHTNGVDALDKLMDDCCIPETCRPACMEMCAVITNRILSNSNSSAEAWAVQSQRADHSSNQNTVRDLATIYPSDVLARLQNSVPDQEAFGATIDMVIPDLKISLTAAIMNFHARIIPRLLPIRTTDQPNATYTKEYLEVYDNSKHEGKAMRLLDLYADPKFARNELQQIIPLAANDTEGEVVVKDGILKIGPKANILTLSLNDTLPGYDKINRTDIIEENVKLEYVYVSLNNGTKTEIFQIKVPESFNRLSRAYNSHDSADRQGDFDFSVKLYNNSTIAGVGGDTTTWNEATTEILAGLADSEFIRLRLIIKPSLNLKRGIADCQGSFTVEAGHEVDPSKISADTTTLATTLAAATGHDLVGYTLDARFSEANLRKTNISMMTHRVPFAYDIPVGRNYTVDYAIGQVNAEENAANLMKVIGIGQDDVQLTQIVKTIESTFDRINNFTADPKNIYDHVGADFVAGDKVRPTIFLGSLDFSKLNTIRDADRSGDIKQKARTYLNGVTSRLLQLSFLQQQLGGSTTATFRCVTSMEVLGNIFSVQHIHNHMVKDDMRNIGDGIEYILVLDNGVRLEFITSTFDYMRNKLVMVPVLPGNADTELNFAQVWNNGNMVAHYTPSGDAAWHRLFANVRELLVVTNPVACILDVVGMDVVTGIATDSILRPTIGTFDVIAQPYGV